MKKKVVGRGLIAALIAIAIILGVQYGTAWHTYRTALDFPEAAQASGWSQCCTATRGRA